MYVYVYVFVCVCVCVCVRARARAHVLYVCVYKLVHPQMAELAGLVADGKLCLLLERESFANHRLALRKGWEAMRERRMVMTFE